MPRIIVEGNRPELERRAYSFVSAITHRGYAVESLARWQKPICLLVAGIPREQGQFILAGVSQAVIAAGAPLASEECKANFYIVVTSEPDKAVKLWRKRDRRLFALSNPATIRRVLNAPRPIRVLYITESACASTMQGMQHGADSHFDMWYWTSACGIKDSRLEFNYVDVLSHVIVIVDFDHIEKISLGPLTDYIAMIGLAKLDLDADVGDAETVLRLFADAAHRSDAVPQRMSAWDRAFLKGLYQTSSRSRFQRSAIARQMADEFTSP